VVIVIVVVVIVVVVVVVLLLLTSKGFKLINDIRAIFSCDEDPAHGTLITNTKGRAPSHPLGRRAITQVSFVAFTCMDDEEASITTGLE